MACCKTGPGYASPADARNGPRERFLFVTAPHAQSGADSIMTVDVDPGSDSYTKIISRVDLPNIGDEVHHTGWNACSSCHDKPCEKRSHLIVPCLHSDRVYIINTLDPKKIHLDKTIEPEDLHNFNVSFPHTSHCLADGNIMISTLGTKNGEGQGDFLLIDGKTFTVKGTWPAGNKKVKFNYDYWYQPRRNIMISTEWGTPNCIKNGFELNHVNEGHYGNSLHVFKWDSHEHIQSIDLPMPQGATPLEIRFLHNPSSEHAFVGTALGSSLFHIYPDPTDKSKQTVKLVDEIKAKKVTGWLMDEMPAMFTDIIISMDDRYLYVSCWFHGEILQYDISNPDKVFLNGSVSFGGLLTSDSGVKIQGEEKIREPTFIKGRKICGGPQMLQLSLDGKRLYVTTSLYKKWDQQFFPKQLENGAVMLMVDICQKSGKMTLNQDFLVDFGKLEGGPFLAHEMRYPGGDCTSDIWI